MEAAEKINYDRLEAFTTPVQKREYIERCFSVMDANDIYLSDLFANSRKRQAVLSLLAEKDKIDRDTLQPPWTWRILVLKDEWGNVPQPGDKVERVIPVNRKRPEGPVGSGEINASMVDGSYRRRFERVRAYTVDEKGCITVPFEDAGYFLTQYGIHYVSRMALCGHPELSTDPVKSPVGSLMHVHYWRYAEVDAATYETLPSRAPAADQTKRGK